MADTGAEKLNVYDAVKAVMGLGDPVGAKNKERGVKGVLARLLGDTAKHGFYQQKILGSPTNLSGRAQALPNPDLDMDEVGIPEAIAWNVYHPFVVRRMVRQGIPRVEAARMAADKHPRAKRALLDEMADRPILMTRYPALHRHSVMAFNPRLTAGSGVQVNNLVTKPYGGDFDGDAGAVEADAWQTALVAKRGAEAGAGSGDDVVRGHFWPPIWPYWVTVGTCGKPPKLATLL
jgi:DNA-directed RNA polymerase subunit beta'